MQLKYFIRKLIFNRNIVNNIKKLILQLKYLNKATNFVIQICKKKIILLWKYLIRKSNIVVAWFGRDSRRSKTRHVDTNSQTIPEIKNEKLIKKIL